MKITKETIGKTVWLVPTGNAIDRSSTKTPMEQAQEATITEMARVKGKFIFKDSTMEQSFSISGPNGEALNCGSNYGFEAYSSYEQLVNAIKADKVRSYLRDNWNTIPENELIEMGSILNLDLSTIY